MSNPPKYILFDEKPYKDVGTHFESPSGDKISVVTGWEEGTRIDEQTYKSMLKKSEKSS